MHPAALARAAYNRAYNHPEADHARMPHWNTLIAWHRRHAILVTTPTAFLLSRPVTWSRDDHAELRTDRHPTPGAYHVTAAAGDPAALLEIARQHHATHISYERIHTTRLHRITITQLQRHLFTRGTRPPLAS